MLRIDHLRVRALAPVSFALASGECVAVMGPSGSGKTVLLRAIADLDPAPGQIFLEGAERAEMTGPAWRQAVRYVAAEPGWWAERIGAHFPLDPQRAARRDRLLDSLGLPPDILDVPVARASTGERQRLGLVRALMDEPKVLLLDEPTTSLDPTSAALVEEAVRYQLLLSRSVLLVTHDLAQAQRLARKLIKLEAKDGKFAAHFYEFAAGQRPMTANPMPNPLSGGDAA
jgi:putative ABC transport system ATP-binding protein